MTISAPAPARKRRFRWWVYAIVLLLILGFMISPIVPVSVAENTARAHGCTIDEGYVRPCIVDGKDIGPDLHNWGLMGWYFLATGPIGIILLVAWLVIALVHRAVWGRAVKRLESPQ